jgi:hypothetical protein
MQIDGCDWSTLHNSLTLRKSKAPVSIKDGKYVHFGLEDAYVETLLGLSIAIQIYSGLLKYIIPILILCQKNFWKE